VRKSVVIIRNIVVRHIPYRNLAGYLFDEQKRKTGIIKKIKKQMDKFALTNEDLEIATI